MRDVSGDRFPGVVELRKQYPQVRLNADDVPLGPQGLRTALREADIVLPTVSDQLPAGPGSPV